MFTREVVIARLRELTHEIKDTGLQLKKVVLYGSYARNEQHQWSDIDVAFVADEFTGIGFEDVQLFVKSLVSRPTLDIQPRTYNTSDFYNGDDPMIEQILKYGIEIT